MGKKMQTIEKSSSRAVMTSGLLAAAVSLLSTGPRAGAAVVTVNLPAAQNVTLFGGSSEKLVNATSSGPGMFVGSDGSGAKRGLIEFDVAGNVPAGATIQSASLTLYLGMVAGSAGGTDPTAGDGKNARTVQLFDATSPWHGTTLGTTGHPDTGSRFGGTGHGFSPPNASDSTWNYQYFDPTHPTAWQTAGGGGDFVSTPSASLTFAAGQSFVMTPYTWTSSAMTTDVQAWLDGTMENDGWLLKNTEEAAQSFRAFYTADGAVEQGHPDFAPVLSITYSSVPEPAALGLLATGSLLVLRRRPPLHDAQRN